MESIRLPRFKRTAGIAPMHLTERDRTVIRLVYRNRFLCSSHIVALIEDSAQPLLRRLQLLYHHGFLERPRAQLDYYHRDGSREIVYGLGNKSVILLRQELGSAFRPLNWTDKNRSIGRPYLEHVLLVSDVMVALELACRKASGVRLLTGDDLRLPGEAAQPSAFKWSVKVKNQVELGIIPDRVFALDSADQSPDRNPAFFFLEADRGTMPLGEPWRH